MSTIAAKKAAQQKKGPETIFNYMGVTFVLVILIQVLVLVLAHYEVGSIEMEINNTSMTPILYFLLLAGLCFGVGSHLRETHLDMRHWSDWTTALVIVSILIGAILGAYQW